MNAIKSAARKVSRFIKPGILYGLQHSLLKIGYEVTDLRIASWVIRRPEWLIQNPGVTILLEPALPRETNPDSCIAERIVRTHERENARCSTSNPIPIESIWGVQLQKYQPMRKLIESGDIQHLAQYQSKLFRTETVDGYTYGTTFDSLPHRWHYLPLGIELSVVTLAEAIGILRAECPEQGHIAFWRKILDEEQIIAKLETFFCFRIEAPRQGDPHGIMFGGRFLTRETCNHLYSAYRIQGILDRRGLGSDLKIVEIGGGYGGTCYWLRKLLGARIQRYVIVDLAEVGMVQAYFLGTAHPESLVLPGESCDGIASPIELVPHYRLDEIDFRPTILLNQDSMPEMPAAEVERYLEWGAENVDALFISFNQETLAPWAGVDQISVPEIISRQPRYRRISRDTAWERRGYVEEVYAVGN